MGRTKRVNCERLYKGRIDIRDYIVKEAITKGITIEVTVTGLDGVKTLSPEQLRNEAVAISKPFESKFSKDATKTYKLISYDW